MSLAMRVPRPQACDVHSAHRLAFEIILIRSSGRCPTPTTARVRPSVPTSRRKVHPGLRSEK
eukprot:12739323-Alexandrium_andersonii.AAC.1